MNARQSAVLSLTLLAALTPVAVLPAHAQGTETEIRSLVRSLGYGAGIHAFKNYVLRGSETYRMDAQKSLALAADTVRALRSSPTLEASQARALDAVAGVIATYRANLIVAQQMVADGRSIADIDAAVRIDDTPATDGLATLRRGRTWTALDALESALGYAGAIHHFKNYVLRGSDDYRTKAIARFEDVARQIAALGTDTSLAPRQKKALSDLDGVVRQYVANVEVVHRMIGERRSVTAIDAVVKVDDTPAIAALMVLRQ